MTPEERGALQRAGQLLSFSLLELSILDFFFGVTIGIAILVLPIFWKHGKRSIFKKFMFFSITLATLISLVEWSHTTYSVSTSIFQLYKTGSKSQKTSSAEVNGHNFLSTVWYLPLLMADFIVFWRAWILYTNQRWVMVLPCLTYIGSLASLIAFGVRKNGLILSQGIDNRIITPTTSPPIESPNDPGFWLILLSFATNLLSTLAIGAKLYMYRKLFRGTKLTSSQQVLLVLVESGFIFCILQFMDMMFFVIPVSPKLDYALAAVDALFFAILPLYPMMVFVLANNNTMATIVDFSSDSSTNTADVELASQETRVAT